MAIPEREVLRDEVIIEMINKGLKQSEIAPKLNLTRQRVGQLVKRLRKEGRIGKSEQPATP